MKILDRVTKTRAKAPPRTATTAEDHAFNARLREALDRVQKRLALLNNPAYEPCLSG